VQDLLLWCTSEVGYLRLADGFVQCSSIMPQKRNPVALEHARSIASKALGQAAGIMIAVHNTPFGDIVDTEDDLQPLVFSMFRDATRAVKLVAAAMTTAAFDARRLEARAADGWTTLTELADTLVRDHGLPFRTAHAISSRLMHERERDSAASLSDTLARVSADLIGVPLAYDEAAIEQILSARHFIQIRRTLGGPAPEETARAARQSRAALESDEEWWNKATRALGDAEQKLREQSEEL
jgi:argininosuccinate lyase